MGFGCWVWIHVHDKVTLLILCMKYIITIRFILYASLPWECSCILQKSINSLKWWGTHCNQFYIHVGDPPVIPPPNGAGVNIVGGEYCLPIGGQIELVCTVQSGTPVVRYEWRADSSSTVLSTEETYTVTQVGSYQCVAINDFGQDMATSRIIGELVIGLCLPFVYVCMRVRQPYLANKIATLQAVQRENLVKSLVCRFGKSLRIHLVKCWPSLKLSVILNTNVYIHVDMYPMHAQHTVQWEIYFQRVQFSQLISKLQELNPQNKGLLTNYCDPHMYYRKEVWPL